MQRTEVLRRPGSVVGTGGGHPNVNDRDVRYLVGHRRHERVRVTNGGDHFVASLSEQSREAFAKEHGIVCDGHAHQIVTETEVPAPAGLRTTTWPASADTRSRIEDSPKPGVAPPTPSSETSTRTIESRRATWIRSRVGGEHALAPGAVGRGIGGLLGCCAA